MKHKLVYRLPAICLLLYYILVPAVNGYGTYSVSNPAEGDEYQNDILIGTSGLYNDGNHMTYYDRYYHIILLAMEGRFHHYVQDTGFLVGFQWYSKIKTAKVNLQLYHINQSSSEGTPGNYTLKYQTGWIASTAGFNTHYIDGGIAVNQENAEAKNYVMAIMSRRGAKTAILHDVCVGDGKVILRASVESEVNIGDDVHFNNCKQTSKIYNCISFSMQGIFTKTQFALPGSHCKIHVAPYKEHAITIKSPLPIQRENNYICWIVRSTCENCRMKVKNKRFSVLDSPDCIAESLRIEEFSSAEYYQSTKVWGTYCGKKFFKAKTTQDSYIRMIFHRSLPSRTGSFVLKVHTLSGDDDRVGLTCAEIILIATGCVLLAAIFYIKIKYDSKHNNNDNQSNPNTPDSTCNTNNNHAITTDNSNNSRNDSTNLSNNNIRRSNSNDAIESVINHRNGNTAYEDNINYAGACSSNQPVCQNVESTCNTNIKPDGNNMAERSATSQPHREQHNVSIRNVSGNLLHLDTNANELHDTTRACTPPPPYEEVLSASYL